MLEYVQYLLVEHFRAAVLAAILFAGGLVLSLPVARVRLRAVEWLPLRVLRVVMRLMGVEPGLARMAAVIWLFNSSVMFFCLASGFRAFLPKVFAVWTGLNIGLVMVWAGRDDDPVFAGFGMSGAGQWVPPKALAWVCGLLVLGLELPCFWYAVGMGVSLGKDVHAGGEYFPSLWSRSLVYVCLIVPTLLVSAIAESVAIRGAAAMGRRGAS